MRRSLTIADPVHARVTWQGKEYARRVLRVETLVLGAMSLFNHDFRFISRISVCHMSREAHLVTVVAFNALITTWARELNCSSALK
jgi:hypothetical protein